MPPSLGEDGPSHAYLLTVASAGVGVMVAIMTVLGADPAETWVIAYPIIGLVIAYLTQVSGRNPGFRP